MKEVTNAKPLNEIKGATRITPAKETLKPAGVDSKGMPTVTIEKPQETERKITLSPAQYKIAKSNIDSANSLFSQVKALLSPPEQPKKKFVPNLYNSVYIPGLGISIPKTDAQGRYYYQMEQQQQEQEAKSEGVALKPSEYRKPSPEEKIFRSAALEEDFTAQDVQNIVDEASGEIPKYDPFAQYKRKKIIDNVNNTANVLKNGTYEDVANLLEQKKQKLKEKEDKLVKRMAGDELRRREDAIANREPYSVNRDYLNIGKINSEINKIETDFTLTISELEEVFKNRSDVAQKASVLYQEPEKAVNLSDQDLRNSFITTGNKIANLADAKKRNTFDSFKHINDPDGVNYIADKTKDYYALDGAAAEIKSSIAAVDEINRSMEADLEQLALLNQQLDKDPTNTEIVKNIQEIVQNKINPAQNKINSYKKYIERINKFTLTLSGVAEDINRQQKTDGEFQKLMDNSPSLFSFAGLTSTERLQFDGERLKGGAKMFLNGIAKSLITGGQLLDQLEVAVGATSETDARLRSINLEKENLDVFSVPSQMKGEGVKISRNEKGELDIDFNANVLIPGAVKTTLEMIAMRKIGQPFEAGLSPIVGKTAGQFAGLYVGSAAVFGGEIFQNELKKGLSIKDAAMVTSFRLGVEAATEMLNPLEFANFDKAKGFLSQMTKKQYLDFVGNNYKSIVPVLKSKGIDVLKFFAYTGKQAGFESLEEVMSDLGNYYGVDRYIIENIKPSYETEKPTLNSLAVTAITTAITMAPTAIYSGYSQVKADKSSIALKYEAAKNPKFFIENLEASLKQGAISKEFYDKGKSQIDEVSSFYEPNKQIIEALDDDYKKADYLYLLLQQDKLSKGLFTEQDDKVKERIVNRLVDISSKLDEYNKESGVFLSPEEKAKAAKEKQFRNLQEFVTDENITGTTIEDLEIVKDILNNVIQNNPEERFKEQAKKHLEKVNARIEYLQNNPDEEPQDVSYEGLEAETKPAEVTPIEPEVELEPFQYLQKLAKEGDPFITQEELDNLDEFDVKEKVLEHKKLVANQQADAKIEEALKIEDLEQRKAQLETLKSEFEASNLNKAVSRVEEILQTPEAKPEDKRAEIERRRKDIISRKSTPEEKFDFLENIPDGTIIKNTDGDEAVIIRKKITKRGTESYELIPLFINEDGVWEENFQGVKIVERKSNGEFNTNAELPQIFTSDVEIILPSDTNYNTELSTLEAKPAEEAPETIDAATALGVKPEEKPEVTPIPAVSDLEAKKADIEAAYSYITTRKYEGNRRDEINKVGEDLAKRFVATLKEKGIVKEGFRTAERTDGSVEKVKVNTDVEGNNLGNDWSTAGKFKDEFRKFVDAELSELEKAKPTEEAKPSEFKVGDKVKVDTEKDGEGVIKEDRGDKVLLQDGRQVSKKNLILLEKTKAEQITIDLPPTTVEVKPEVKEVEPKEVGTQESDKKEIEKIADIVETPANPLTTSTFQKPSVISKIWNSSLRKIKQLADSTGKSFSELGYTISILKSQEIPFDNLNEDTQKYFSKGFENGKYIEDKEKRKKDDGRYAVITNEKGQVLYFNEDGEMSTTQKEGYKLAISTFPRDTEKMATRPSKEQLSFIGKTIEWYNNQIERLKNLRKGDRKTLLIEDIIIVDNKFTNVPQDLKSLKGQVENVIELKGRIFLKVKGKKNNIGVSRRKLTEKEATSLANILLSKAKDKPLYDGLPDSLNKLLDRFNYVRKFIVTGLNYYHVVNGKNIWVDLDFGKNGDKPGVYVKIGSKDAEWKKLTHEEVIRLFMQLDMNINKSIPFESSIEFFNFEDGKFKATEYDSYTDFILENFESYQKVTPEGKDEDHYIVFGEELGTTAADLGGVRKDESSIIFNIKKALKALNEKVLVTDPSDKNYYINKDNPSEKYARVSTLKGEFDGTAGDSANRGTIIDNLLRDYVAGAITSFDQFKDSYAKYSEKYQAGEFTEKFLTDLFNIFEEIKEVTKDVELISDIPTMWGTLNGQPFAGTIDLLGIRKDGSVFIIDLKTSSQNRRDEEGRYYQKYKEGDTIQQSAYAELLRQRTGIEIKNITILPIQVIKKGSKYVSAKANKDAKGMFTMPVTIDRNLFPEQKPVVEEKQDPVNEPNPAVDETGVNLKKYDVDDETDISFLERSTELSSEVTEEQNKEAEEWFENTPLRGLINFNHLKNIVNSNAFATWTASSITLWKAGNFTDLYHEAWHEFSQLYLTVKQKQALYAEAAKSALGKEAIKKHANKLNKSVKELTDKERFFALEEMLAEDFRKYAIAFKSGKALILDQRFQRNNIFRKIINLLREWLTGNVDIQTYYERLYTGNIANYTRNTENAFFGVLNSALTGSVDGKKVSLTTKEAKSLFRAVDAIINNFLQKNGKSITVIFDNPKALSAVYVEALRQFKIMANKAKEKYQAEEDPTKKEALKKTIDNLEFIIQNWETKKNEDGRVIQVGLKYQHKDFSKYFDVSKEKLEIDETEEFGIFDEEGFDGEIAKNKEEQKQDLENDNNASVVKNENVSSREAADNQVLYLLASLSKYDSSGNVMFNDFLPDVPELTDFKNTWDILSQNLSGITDYKRMIQKIEELSKRHKQFEELLNRIPKADQIVLSPSELRLRNAFINSLSGPTVLVHETVVDINTNGSVTFRHTTAEFKAESTLKKQYIQNFKESDLGLSNDPYVGSYLGNNYLKLDKENKLVIIKEFRKYFPTAFKAYEDLKKEIGEDAIFLQRIAFLQYLGMTFSDATLASESFRKSILNNDQRKGLAVGMFNGLERAQEQLNREKKVEDPQVKELTQQLRERIRLKQEQIKEAVERGENTEELEAELNRLDTSFKQSSNYIFDPISLITAYKNYGDAYGYFRDIVKEEVKNSDLLFSQSVKNAAKNTVYQIRQWSYITRIYDALNDEIAYPTYQDLQQSPWLQQLNIDVNPYINGVFLNTLFDLKTGLRRKVQGTNETVKINLQDYNGLRLNTRSGATNPGKTTVNLTFFEKLVQNFNTLLLFGVQEHLRYGDKSSSFGTTLSGLLNLDGKVLDSQKLIIPIESFSYKGDKIPVPPRLLKIMYIYLATEMMPMYNNRKYGVGNDVKYYKENIKKLGIFEGVLSEETQEKIINKILDELVEQEGEVTIDTIINKFEPYNSQFIKEFKTYFEDQVKPINSIFESVKNVLDIKKFIDENLSKNHNQSILNYAYAVNSFIYNVEHTKLITGDPRFYKTKYKDGKETTGKLDPFKRFSQYTATGNLFIVDDATNESISKAGRGLLDALVEKGVKILNDQKKSGIINSVIFKDDESPSELLEVYRDYFVNKLGYSVEKASKMLKAYGEINRADGQGFVTLDEYRESKKRAGSSHWTQAHEEAYKKEVDFFAGKKTEGMSPEERVLFVPQKWQYSGISVKKVNIKGIQLNIPIPVFYKFSVVPLIPSAIKDTRFEQIHENLIRQNVGLALFESGSKHSSFTNEKGEFNKFFEDSEARTPYTGEYTINPIFYQYLKEQVNVEPELKEKVTFSTQMRKLITLNLFDNGIPKDYKGEKDWDSLSEEEKLEQSFFYKTQQRLSNVVDKLIGIERDNIITEIGAKWNEKTKEYDINAKKLSEFLKKEFIKRDLPDEVIDYLQLTENGKFKYPLDASTQREKIEKMLYAIADKRLVQQKVSGEALIQVAASGFEINGKFRKPTTEELQKYGFGNSDLMGYLPEGRIVKKDGKEVARVTSASKVKVSFNSKWESLLDLDHPDGNPIKVTKTVIENGVEVQKVDYEASIKRLNEAIKDEDWLDKGQHRKMVTIVGVRIPVQGLNSKEFMEVYEFLPPSTGNLIIVHPELVAKSGGDFDIDKLTTFFPNLMNHPLSGKPMLVTKISDEQLQKYYEYQNERLSKLMRSTEAIDKLIGDIFNVDPSTLSKVQRQEAIEEIFEQSKLPSFQQFKNKYKKKAYENEAIDVIRQILEHKDNFEQLVRPNTTDLLEPEAKKLKEQEIKDEKELDENGRRKRGVWSNLVEFKTILEQFKSNLVGKSNLGIAAVYNTFFSLAQFSGLYLNEVYMNEKSKIVPTRINFKHNTVNVDGVSKISLSGSKDWKANIQNLKDQANYISDVISQFINGFVDVAKDDWIFFINAVKEYVPTMLFLTTAGVDSKTMIAYFTSPIMKLYIQEYQKYRNLFVMTFDNNAYKFAKRRAFVDIMLSKFDKLEDQRIIDEIKRIKNINDQIEEAEEQLKSAETSADESYYREKIENLGRSKNATISNVIANLQIIAAQNKKLFTFEKLEQKDKITEDEQILLLAHFFELEKLSSEVTNLQRAIKSDTEKLESSFSIKKRERLKDAVYDSRLFSENALTKMFEKSNIKGFTNEKSGIDSFVSKLYKNVFEVLGTDEFDNWLFNTFASEGLRFEYKTYKTGEYVKAIKSGLIAYIFQNNAFFENTPNAIVDITAPSFRQASSINYKLSEIKRKYPSLKDTHPILFKLKFEKTPATAEMGEYHNIVFSSPLVEAEEINEAIKQMRSLANFDDSKYTKEEQLEIQDFAKKLINFAIIQSSARSDKYNLMNMVPSEFYSPKIAAAINGMSKLLKEGNVSDLNTFFTRFKIVAPSFFGGSSVKVPFYNYKTNNSRDLTGERQKAELSKFKEKVEKLKERVEVIARTRNSALLKASPEKHFIVASRTKQIAEKENNQLKNNNVTNATYLVFEGVNDLNYNQEASRIIEEFVKEVVNVSGTIVFGQDGYGTELKQNNKLAYEYISKQLYDIFGYTNPDYVPVSDEAPAKPQVKREFVGKFIYSTPGSGKTTLSKTVENVVDTDNLIVEEMNKRHPNFKQNPGESIQDFIFRYVKEYDHKAEINAIVLENAKKLTSEGKTVLTGTIAFIKDVDLVFRMRPENERMLNRFGSLEEAKKFSAKERELASEANKKYIETTGIERSIAENLPETEVTPTEAPVSTNPKDFVNHSGGAYGGDTFWDIIGREFGVTEHRHYRDAGNESLSKQLRDKGIKATVLSKEQMDKARTEVENLLGKKYPDTLEGNLQVRNYYQVANSDAVFAVAKLDISQDKSKADNLTDINKSIKSYKFDKVSGGTNTAVQLGIKLNKPVYVWDITTEKWYKFVGDRFQETPTPTLTKNFAGVGSRDIESYNVQDKETKKWKPRKEYIGEEKEKKAKQAIRDVYANTFKPTTPTVTTEVKVVSEPTTEVAPVTEKEISPVTEEIAISYENFLNLKPSTDITLEDWKKLTPEEQEVLINQAKNC